MRRPVRIALGLACVHGLAGALLGAQSPAAVSRADRISAVESALRERLRTFGTDMVTDVCGLAAFVGPGPEFISALDPRVRQTLGVATPGGCEEAKGLPTARREGWIITPLSVRPDTVREFTAEQRMRPAPGVTVRLSATVRSSMSRLEEYTVAGHPGSKGQTTEIRLFNFEYY